MKLYSCKVVVYNLSTILDNCSSYVSSMNIKALFFDISRIHDASNILIMSNNEIHYKPAYRSGF